MFHGTLVPQSAPAPDAAQARPISMLEVIQGGAAPKPRARHLPCPWCGDDPPLAIKSYGFSGFIPRFQVGCENSECPAQPQVSGETLEEVWARWNRRA